MGAHRLFISNTFDTPRRIFHKKLKLFFAGFDKEYAPVWKEKDMALTYTCRHMGSCQARILKGLDENVQLKLIK